MIFGDYVKRKKAFDKEIHDINEWSEWSMQKQDAKDIIFREMMSAMNEENYACATYYCFASDLTEEDIDALLFVNSGLFTYEGWDDATQEFVISLLQKGDKANVYEDLRRAIADKRFNEPFTKKMKEVCNKAIDTRLGTMNARKNDISSAIYQMLMSYKEVAESKKLGEENPKARKHIGESLNALKKAIERLEGDMPKFDDERVFLSDRLDWKVLLQKKNLSEEYLERRKALWEYTLR